MKRVIEIDETTYTMAKRSLNGNVIPIFTADRVIGRIAISKPLDEVLDKIISDIENIKYLACPQPEDVLNDVKDIIAKYKESGDK